MSYLALTTIFGTAALGLVKNKIGSHSKKVTTCDEIRLDYTIRLNSITTNLDHISRGWSTRKFINKANIIEVSIRCIDSEIDDDDPFEYGEYLYAYFHVFVKLKGKCGDLKINDEMALIIFEAIKELWSEKVLPFASEDAETEIQLGGLYYRNFYSIKQFLNDYIDVSDIKESLIGPDIEIKESFYIADKDEYCYRSQINSTF